MSFVNGELYRITDKATDRVVDADRSKAYTNPWNGGGYQKWTAIDNGDGTWRFQSQETGLVLDSNDTGSVYPLGWNSGGYQRWEVESAPQAGYVNLKNRQTGRYLDSNQTGSIYTLGRNGGDFQAWLPTLLGIEWQVAPRRLEFEKPNNWTPQPTVVRTQELINNSDGQLQEEFAYDYATTSTFEWGLEQRLGLTYTMEAEISIPELAAVKNSMSVSLDLGSHQTWTKSENLTYRIADTITVPPKTRLRASATIEEVHNVEIPFKLQLSVSASHGENKKPGEKVREMLYASGFQGVVTEVRSDSVIAELRGKLSSTYGVNTLVDVEPLMQAVRLAASEGAEPRWESLTPSDVG